MNDWRRLANRATLHIVRGETTLCGIVYPIVIDESPKSRSLCNVCKMYRGGYTNARADNTYMNRHFKELGLDSQLVGGSE